MIVHCIHVPLQFKQALLPGASDGTAVSIHDGFAEGAGVGGERGAVVGNGTGAGVGGERGAAVGSGTGAGVGRGRGAAVGTGTGAGIGGRGAKKALHKVMSLSTAL